MVMFPAYSIALSRNYGTVYVDVKMSLALDEKSQKRLNIIFGKIPRINTWFFHVWHDSLKTDSYKWDPTSNEYRAL